MPTKQQSARKRKKQWYADNSDAAKKRRIEVQVVTLSSNKQATNAEWYGEKARTHKKRAKRRYDHDMERSKAKKAKCMLMTQKPKENREMSLYAAENPDTNESSRSKEYSVEKRNEQERYEATRRYTQKLRKLRYKRERDKDQERSRLRYLKSGLMSSQSSGALRNRKNNPLVIKNAIRKRKKNRITGLKNNKLNVFNIKFNTEQAARCIAIKFKGRTFSERLLKAKLLVNSCLHAHKALRTMFKKQFNSLKNFAKNTLMKADLVTDLTEKAMIFSGHSLHTSRTEPFFWDFCYRPYAGSALAFNTDHQAVNIFPEHLSFKTKNGYTNHQWQCNDNLCIIESDKIMSQMRQLLNTISNCPIKKSGDLIINLHKCSNTMIGLKYEHSLNCYSGDCCSKIPYMRTISPHYPEIRSFLIKISRLNSLVKKMLLIKQALLYSQIKVLEDIENEGKKSGKSFSPHINLQNTVIESEVLNKYFSAFQVLENRNLNSSVIPCVSCEKLFTKRKVSRLKNLRTPIRGQVWDKLKELKEEETINGFICRGCLERFRKSEMPSTCILNGLQTFEQPQQILCLNNFEKVLIQRAKAFQVVTKMNSVSNKVVTSRHQVRKVIGRTFHLPLPLEETLKRLPKATDPLTYHHELYILVRGVPTKAKIVWQMMVSINKVYEALKYLKKHNPLYQSIILPDNAKDLLDCMDSNNLFNLDKLTKPEPNVKRRSMLTQVSPEDWEAEENHYTIHALHEAKSCESNTNLYQMLKISEFSIGYENKEIDLLCFPDLYPTGKFGQFYPRLVKLSSAEFIKCRLLSKNPQFRLNLQYIFYLLHDANIRQLKQGIFHKLNVTSYKGALTAAECLRSMESGNLEGNLTSVFSKLRNTSQYWIKPRNDVNCMAHHYGPATWFLTMSPSEWNWEDLALYIQQVNKSIPGIGKKSASELVALDPVSASKFIDNKFHAMLDFILCSDAPLGKVVHYFYRREYQSRGLQHFHLLLWVEDAPVLGSSSNAEVAVFIQKYVTCSLPIAAVSPTLHTRVTKYQTHYHNSYCMRNKKTKVGYRKVCRFGFPRPVSEVFVLRDVVESIAGRKALKSKCRLYDLPRNPRESNINDYNAAVLLAWNGNVDLQYVGEKTSILHWYVTKYTTKSETCHVGQAFNEINSTNSLGKKLFNVGMRALSNRECGALEASDTLLGIPLYGTDPGTTIRWLDVAMERKKRLQKIDKLKSMDPETNDIFYESWVDDYYPKRAEHLKDMSLYDFVRWFDIKTSKLKGERECYNICKNKYLMKRLRPCIINHYKYSIVQEPEKYYYALLLMFLPWRSTEILMGNFSTYKESFMSRQDSLLKAVEYDARCTELQAATDAVKEKIKNRKEELESEDHPEDADPMNAVFVPAEAVDSAMANMHALADNNVNDVSSESFLAMCSKLSNDQRRVFEHVKSVLTDKNKEMKVLRQFVSGVGGTGKSFLINIIRRWTKEQLQARTAVSAPTGLSAFNINGSTIYKLFQLPVEHGRIPKYRVLSDDTLKIVRDAMKGVVLFIIDEISMVSNLTLMYIHLRLCEIFDTADVNDGWFGKKHIILFGDLLQLPPVHEDSPFVELDSEKLKNYIGSLKSINLWSELFTYDELTINMRQAEDPKYGNLLNRVRVGRILSEDVKFLEAKKIPLPGNVLKDRIKVLGDYLGNLPSENVCLCATGNQCAKINEEMLKRINEQLINLEAKDSVDCQPQLRNKVNKIVSKYDTDCTRTAGMEKVISVKVGAKVMLRRNLDVTKGLVNSSIGVIHKIKFNFDKPKEVDTVTILFQNGITHDLERVTTKFEVIPNAFVFREQFPITVSYGVTIHKCQGLSLKTAVMDIGESIFSCGQTYVALSRVTSSQGLHLINLNPKNVKAQATAILEYNRLRSKYKPELELLPIEAGDNTVKYIRDTKWCLPRGVDVVQEGGSEPSRAQGATCKRTSNHSAYKSIRGLTNLDNVSCYANAIVQMFYSSTAVRDTIKTSISISEVLKAHLYTYERLPEGEVMDTLIIRTSTDNLIYAMQEQQDSALFMLDLLQNNPGLAELLLYSSSTTTLCDSCQYTFRGSEEFDTVIRVPMNESRGTLEKQLELITREKWETLTDYRCENCSVVGRARKKSIIVSTRRNLIVQFLIFNNNLEKIQSTKLNGVSKSKLKIGAKTYKPAAAIFHIGPTVSSGHYIAFIKTGNKWICVNDNVIQQTRWPTGSKNLYMLFLIQDS